MEKTIRKMVCDICGKEDSDTETWREDVFSGVRLPTGWTRKTITVRFVTSQNDGTGTEPYLDNVTVDMCPECYKEYLRRCPVKASGAQGFNCFEWTDKNDGGRY